MWDDSCLLGLAFCGWLKMIGIDVMVGLIILEATGLVSVADSVSYWLLNDMLLMISFDMNSPWITFWNETGGKGQPASGMFQFQWSHSTLRAWDKGAAWKSSKRVLEILGQSFPHIVESSLYVSHMLVSWRSPVIQTVATALLVMGMLMTVVVVLWLCRYGSFLSQILRILVLCFQNCKLLNKSSVFRGLLRAPSGGNIETLKQEK